MHHRNLYGEEIRRLVAERDAVKGMYGGLEKLLRRMNEIVLPRFSNGKKLSAEALREIFELLEVVMTEGMEPSARWFAEVGATRIHPNGEKMEAAYVFVMDDGKSFFRLYGMRVEGTRKKIKFEVTSLPFAFDYHSAERLIERLRGKESHLAKTPLATITKSLMDWAFFLFFTLPIAQERNGSHWILPAPERLGLYLGFFVPNEPLSYLREFDQHNARTSSKPSIFSGTPAFVLKTFVNDDELRPEQQFALDAMAGWQDEFKLELSRERDKLIWPDAKLISREWIGKNEDHRMNALIRQLVEYLRDERFLLGIKPKRDFVQAKVENDFLDNLLPDG